MLINNGLIFFKGEFVRKDIRIENGKITEIGSSLKAESREERLDASDRLVLPGLIDPHVHLRDPGATYKEDFKTGSMAAVAGGFTCVMDMPNNKPPTITKARLEEKKKLAKQKAVCDILFHFGGTDDNFDEVLKANPQSMKLYLGHTTGELMLKDPKSMERHFLNFPKERRIVLHSCDENKSKKSDLETFENALSTAKNQGRLIHLAHASFADEISAARKYRGCSIEVAPQHLFLSTKDEERLGRLSKVNPPLRSEEDRKRLWGALRNVNCIATDHAPHTIEDKDMGAAGFPGLETSFSLMFGAYKEGLIDLEWLVKCMSENVADVFELEARGRIEKGFIGDLTIVDTKKEWTVDHSELYTKCKWSPFDGQKLKGKIETVIKNGKIIYLDGQFSQ